MLARGAFRMASERFFPAAAGRPVGKHPAEEGIETPILTVLLVLTLLAATLILSAHVCAVLSILAEPITIAASVCLFRSSKPVHRCESQGRIVFARIGVFDFAASLSGIRGLASLREGKQCQSC